MKTDKVSVFDLFEKQRRYLVPLFQRGYVWQQVGQWQPLWQDILTQTTVLRSDGKHTSHHHFLGAIVLNQVPTTIRQVAASEIIDGQQRLLTLQVLLLALRDIALECGSVYSQATLARLTTNPGPHLDTDEAHKVWPTNAYQQDLRIITIAGTAAGLAKQFPQTLRYKKLTPPRPPLVDAYLYFASAIHDDLTNEGNIGREQGALEELTDVITRHLQLVSIELDIDDDAQVIFETLNARGVPLEPADLVRNFIFLYATRQKENAPILYDKWWKDFDETIGGKTFWKEKERQGRLTRTRLDLFFYHFVTCRTTHEINVSHLFQEFRTWWNDNPTTPPTIYKPVATPPTGTSTAPRVTNDELAIIHTASVIYRSLIQPTSDDRLDLFARRLKALDTSTLYPVMLWICERREHISLPEFDGILQDLESYLVRRMIGGLTTKNYNRTFLTLLSNLQQDGQPVRASLQRELNALTGDSAVWPDDNTFRNNLIRQPLYSAMNQAKVRLVLEGIERAQRTTKQEAIPIPTILSIEHVLPAADDPAIWPFPPNTTATAEEARLLRETMKQSLGNLTLVTQPLNSSLSCGPFKDKRPAITGNSLLTLNAYFQQFTDHDAWDERTILQRSTQLATVALQVWPHVG